MSRYQLYKEGDTLYNQDLTPVKVTKVKQQDYKISYCTKTSLSEICYSQDDLIELNYSFSKEDIKNLAQIQYLLINSPYHEVISLLLKVIFFEAKLKNFASKKENDHLVTIRKVNHSYQTSVIVNILLLIVIILLIVTGYSFF